MTTETNEIEAEALATPFATGAYPSREAFDAMLVAGALAEPTFKVDHRTFVMEPEGFAARDITDPNIIPEHIKQKVTVDNRQSLSTYANRFQDKRSILIADYDAGTIAAHLDWHTCNQAKGASPLQRQHASHVVTLKLRDSEEYKRWSEMEGKMHSQEDFAFFLEENVSDVVDPEAGVLIEICKDLEATVGTVFKSGVRLDNGDRTFTYETETRTKSELAVPTKITLDIPLYLGEDPTQIRANFRYRPRQDGLLLGFNWHRVEYQREATFREMAFKVSEETGLPVFFGRAT